MLRKLQSEFLGPEDLALCQRVFDLVCADARLDKLSLDGQLLASTVVTTFQSLPGISEPDLLASIRGRRDDFEKLAG